jgi:virginiamycin B lyase
VVTAVGSGSAVVTISDPVRNTFNVVVSVSARSHLRRNGTLTAPAQWTQFKANVPHPAGLLGIVPGPDGALWYTDSQDDLLVRMTTAGVTTPFKLSATISGQTHNFSPGFMTVGTDGRFYLGGCVLTNNTCVRGYIGAATTAGKLSVYKTPSGDDPRFTNLPALGPDGNVWFTESSHIAKVAPSGTITEFTYPNGKAQGYGYPGAVTGPDRNVWFDLPPNSVSKIAPSTGTITTYQVADQYGCTYFLNGIATAIDGKLYVGCGGGSGSGTSAGGVVQVTTTGAFTYFAGGWGPSYGAIEGPDGQAWLFGNYIPVLEEFGSGVIQQFSGRLGATTTYIPPAFSPSFSAIATGPDGNIWGLDRAGFVDVLKLH